MEAIKVAAYDTDRTNRVLVGELNTAQRSEAVVLAPADRESSVMSNSEIKLAKRIENKFRKNKQRTAKIVEAERERLEKILEIDRNTTVDIRSPSVKHQQAK